MLSIDLNADLGEADTPEGQKREAQIISHISSANVACGGHAGDEATMRATIREAKAHGVSLGAHPAYPDKDNFGRKSLVLVEDITKADLTGAITRQIHDILNIAAQEDARIAYVKPHGALYNDAVNDRDLAELIILTVKHINPDFIVMGAPASELEWAAKRYGMRFVREGFIDRRYENHGHLQSRSEDGSVLKTQTERLSQLEQLLKDRQVVTASGDRLPISVDSLCLHGDSDGADETARAVRAKIADLGFTVKAFVHG